MTFISILNIPDSAKSALAKAGYNTVEELQARRIGPNGCVGRLTLIPGINPKLEMAIEEALRMIVYAQNNHLGTDPVEQTQPARKGALAGEVGTHKEDAGSSTAASGVGVGRANPADVELDDGKHGWLFP